MNPAFKEALATRLLWVDVVVLERIEAPVDQIEAAIQAAFVAVHQLASNDVLTYQHYGATAPLLLQDVPELADQYCLAHEVYTELFLTNHQTGRMGKISGALLHPEPPASRPYTQWLASVTLGVAEQMGTSFMQANEAMIGQARSLLLAWSRGETVEESVAIVVYSYEDRIEFEEEEARRKYAEDIADTYASIEADLWAGWREECEDLGMVV